MTHAKGGQSFHNYGLAIDIAQIKDDGSVYWIKGEEKLMKQIVSIAERDNFYWGGYWKGKKKDNSHFQKVFGYSWQQLLNKVNNKDMESGYVKLD